MAFDTASTVAAWHVLFEVDLDSGTVYYADVDLTMDDGTAYEGRIKSVPVLRLSIGALLDPRIISPSFTVSFYDLDHSVRDSTDNEPWGNRTCRLKLGQTTDQSVYETLFTGMVRFPAGVEWDEQETRINVDDLRSKDAKVLPENLFDPSTYPNMESKSQYLPIPIVYGSWLSTDAAGEQLPAYCIDTTASSNKGKFKVADHALKQIEVVYRDGVDITSDCTLDAANGEFTITGGGTAYDPDAHTITVNCQGVTDDGTTSGTLLVDLPDQIDDLLQSKLSVAAANVDSAAFTSWKSNLNVSDESRRWIGGSQISSDDLIRDAMIEGMADLTISSGKYTPAFRITAAAGSSDELLGANIREVGDPPRKDLSVALDPERVFVNQMVSDYQFAPLTDSWAKSYTKTDSDSVSLMGTTKRRRFQFKWLYKQAGVERRTDREVITFRTEPEMLTATLDPTGLTKLPTDQFKLSYDKWDGAAFQVRTAALDLTRKLVRSTCWNMGGLVGRWKATGSNTYANRTGGDDEGYWTENGRADPSSASSVGSKWF